MMTVTQNNVYVHSNPPKAISGQGAAIRNWVKNGDLEKLESVVLEGQGARLLGLMESTGDVKVKAFLKSIPGYMAKVDLIHDAVIRGSLRETQALIDKRKLATARDAVGRGVAHKAVLYNHKPLLDWMAKKYPETIHLKDNEGRTCLHYTAANKEPEELFDVLVSLGATPETIDIHGRKPGYYVNHPEELDIEGPFSNHNLNNNMRSFSRGNRVSTRRISPISPKSTGSLPSSMNITRAQIRIWIHERDISKLERIVWSGNGDKLLLETTNNSKVRRFLDNVPHLLSRIKGIHTSAIQNDVTSLKQLKERTEIVELFTAKDTHGLTPLHKSVGLGNRATVEYLIYEVPSMLNEPDNEGRTPLHYASKDPSLYSFLTRAGADESIQDSKGRTPNFYRTHPNELDTKHLRNIPDAPRVTGELSGWERGFSPQLGMMANKRKISTGEFSQDSMNGHVDEVEVTTPDVGVLNTLAKSGRRDSVKKHNNSGVTKFRKTEESGDEIEDVNDGYVADSDEGKYELSTDFEIQPMEEELDDELDKELQAIGDSSNTQTPNDLVIEEQMNPSMNDRRRSRVKSVAENVVADVEEAARDRMVTPADHEPEGLTDIQQPKMDDDVPDHEPEHYGDPQEVPESHMSKEPFLQATRENEVDESLGLPEDNDHGAKEPGPPPNYENALDPNPHAMDTSVPEPVEVYDVDAYVKNGDMEKLVEMILDGKGGEMIGKESSIHEVQEFLVNVPAYMAKIASIHAAASSGNLRDLQSLLDRKRLAQAKDELGRAPIHQSVLEGHSNVTRYLASNYPQSLNMTDINKRSPLHYAATLGDQGALYKVLIQAGADPNLKDVQGNTPGIYLRRKDLLTQSDLLNMSPQNLSGQPIHRKESSVDTWERPATPNPLNDAQMDDTPVSGRQVEEQEPIVNEEVNEVDEAMQDFTTELNQVPGELRQFPAIWSEEGKYLASVLGDALVKGLTQVSHDRPNDPVEYLANFLKKYRGEEDQLEGKPVQGADDHFTSVIQSLPITMADPMIREAQNDAIEVDKGILKLEEQVHQKVETLDTAVEEMPSPELHLAPKSAIKIGPKSGSKKAPESDTEVAPNTVLELQDSPVNQSTPDEQELLNELDNDSSEMLQRLEDAVDNEHKSDEDDDEDENRIHNVDEMDDPNLGEGESTDNSQNGTRDDRGQSVLHFAAARPGGASTILAFLQNPSVNLSWRDERLRTARDIAKGMSRPDNMRTIDSWIISLAIAGDKESLEQLLIDGYDHLTDVEDSSGTHVIDLAEKAGKREVALFLRSIPDFNDRLIKVHKAVRNGDMENCKNLMMRDHRLAVAMSPWGRTALHVAVLVEEYDIVRFICEHFPDSLKRGDNIERTPLHYAMGVEKVEKMTRILVRNGAKRVVKDLRGRQPSYYFINREEIAILQRQEQDLKATKE